VEAEEEEEGGEGEEKQEEEEEEELLEEGVRNICRQKGRGLIRFKLGIASLAFLTEFVFVWVAEEE